METRSRFPGVADIANRTIVTDKGEVGMAWKDTIRVQCKDTYTVTKAADATWLTVKDLGGNAYELTANVDTYVDNHPRSSYVSITTGNLEKRIPVTQRPDKGTINVHLQDQPTVKEMWLSPPHNQKEVTVTCTGGNWKMLDNLKTASVSGNAGVTNNVKMTRKPDADIYAEDFANAYGRGPVVFKNMRTLDTDTIFVDNLFIGARDEVIEIAQPTSRNDTITTTTDIDVSACPCEFDHKIIELGDDNEDCLVNGKLDSVVRVGFVTEHDVAPLVFTGRMPD